MPISPLDSIFIGLLRSCNTLTRIKLTHAQIVKSLVNPSLYLCNNLLTLYCKYDDSPSACKLFDEMPKRNTVSYNTLISGFSQMGQSKTALKLFMKARKEDLNVDEFTYVSGLNACSRNHDLKSGTIVHALAIVSGLQNNSFLVNSCVNLYAKCGQIQMAEKLFENSNKIDDVTWNSLLSAYARNGQEKETFQLFVKMHRFGFGLNTFALGSVIKACLTLDFIRGLGEMIHGCIIKIGLERNIFMGSSMIDLYSKKGLLHESIKIFKLILNPNVVVYNAIISGFCRNYINNEEITKQALLIFVQMEREGINPSEITFSSVLCACNLANEFGFGKQIHAKVVKNKLENNEFIGSALIDLYCNSSCIFEAFKCFNFVSRKDVIIYTSMISGFVQNEFYEEALELFRNLLQNGKRPDIITVSSAINACSNLGIARSSQQIQVWATKLGFGFQRFVIVGNSFIAMYSKSGFFNEAVRVFQEMESRDVVSWSSIITGHAQHGSAKEALELFEDMEKNEVKPNEVTFLGVLTACCHSGLVDQGLRYYERMKRIYGLEPTVKHNACIVDLLGRAGKIKYAESFVSNSNFEMDLIVGRSLLSSCHKKQIGTAEKVISVDP